MGKLSLLKKVGRALLNSGPKTVTTVNLAQINYGTVLAGKTVVITGGGKGIGYSMAQKFISEGAEVVIAGRNEKVLKESAGKLGNKCHYISYDVSNVESAEAFLHDCKNNLGNGIDYLVCNAGVSLHEGNLKNVTVEGFDQQFNTNFRSGYFLGKAFIEMKLEENAKDSELLMITSETGDMAYDIPYGMTKAALNSMVGGFSRRVYKNGIRVNAIAPGVTVSDMTKSYADTNNLTREGQASGRMFLPEEIAEVACFLLSDASKCISGEVIHCNAGNHLRTFFE